MGTKMTGSRPGNSALWAKTIMSDMPRRSISVVSSRARRHPEIDVPGIAARQVPRHVMHIQDAETQAAGKLVMDEIQ